jgi:hypothetical protein
VSSVSGDLSSRKLNFFLDIQITLHLNASSRSRELEEIRKRDHEELVEIMTKSLHDKNLLKMTLATSTREDAHNVVEAIEQARSYHHALPPVSLHTLLYRS